MAQTIAPKPTPSDAHPLIRIANLEAQIIQLEHRLAKLESLQVSTRRICILGRSRRLASIRASTTSALWMQQGACSAFNPILVKTNDLIFISSLIHAC